MRNLSILTSGYGLSSKLALLTAMVRIKLGTQKPFTCALTLDGKRSVYMRLSGSRDEFTILRDLFIGKEYSIPTNAEVRNILDLGANIGLASAYFRLKYPNALIHAYEPAPRTFTLLQENAKRIGNMEVFAEAIGAQTGSAVFHESDRSVASSLIESAAFQTANDITVPMVTIDTALERIGNVELMKVDIEGAEFDALAAAHQLAKVTFIVGEGHPMAAGRNMEEIRSALSKTHTVTIHDGERLAGFYATVK